MAFPFRFLCELLERLEKTPGGSSDTVIITTLFNERSSVIPRQEPGAIAFLPCLFPEHRPYRVFGLQKRQLESIIQQVQCLGPSRMEELQSLKGSGYLDFAASVERLMAITDCEPILGSELTLEEIDDTLDECLHLDTAPNLLLSISAVGERNQTKVSLLYCTHPPVRGAAGS
ncbi:hypothetical protein NQ176_g1648 [Zarea fungicola]|uniref:Uncharacterized protein n=1 Tax=Zarea fungicola TaxID=93591 RepID=A0ACC1NSZ1_9HYPO|nr:hypothetical protein NQ176_g1648 [Lecanicillium fungicola]